MTPTGGADDAQGRVSGSGHGLRLASSDERWSVDLVEACLEGRVTLADATAEELAASLHRAMLRTPKEKDDPGWRLRVEGFDAKAARALVKARDAKHEAAVLATGLSWSYVRRRMSGQYDVDDVDN